MFDSVSATTPSNTQQHTVVGAVSPDLFATHGLTAQHRLQHLAVMHASAGVAGDELGVLAPHNGHGTGFDQCVVVPASALNGYGHNGNQLNLFTF